MPADITHSNFSPTAKEETLLRILLKQNEDELKATNEQILKARSAIASSKEAMRELTKSRKFARFTIDTYETHTKNLTSSLELLEKRFTFATKGSDPRPGSCVALTDLLKPDILKRRRNTKREIEQLEQICVKVNASILDIDEDLRCQHYIEKVNSKSLESYLSLQIMVQSAVDEISGAFRAIKRVPNEIWSIILSIRVAEDSKWILTPTRSSFFLPALPLSHVCRTWRSVVTSSPSMWQAMQWNPSSDEETNPQYIDLWGKLVGNTMMVIHERQSNAGTLAAQTLRTHLLGRPNKLFYNVVQDATGIPRNPNTDITPKIPILGLGLHAMPSSQNIRVEPSIYSRFSSVKHLSLSNLLPHRRLDLQDSLRHLSVIFFQPHKSYALARLLIPSLAHLTLQHFEMSGTPALEEVVQLPNLRVLSITPLEYKIAERLEMPRLSRLILSSPIKVSASPDGWLASMIALCHTVLQLEIDCSVMERSKKHRDITGFDMIQTLANLLPQSPKLEGITLVGALFEGDGLVDIFEKKETKEGVDFRKLKELTIDNCIGVSRMDCERLVKRVEKLNVYRTFHNDGEVQES